MDTPAVPVEKSIRFIWEHYSEPLSLAEIAGSAGLSRFYFTRMFGQVTGITPGRFLAAIRIYHAKCMLLSTPTTVSGIARAVGYSSLGSFTSHFTDSVGISPGRFRRMARGGGIELPGPRHDRRSARGAVAGTISLPEGSGNARVYLGAFPTPIVAHPPAAGAIVDVPSGQPCCYQLPDVPEGTWFIHAVGVAGGIESQQPGTPSSGPRPAGGRAPLAGGHDPVTVAGGTVVSAAVRLRPRRPLDPPVLLALPELEPPRRLIAAATPCAALSVPPSSR